MPNEVTDDGLVHRVAWINVGEDWRETVCGVEVCRPTEEFLAVYPGTWWRNRASNDEPLVTRVGTGEKVTCMSCIVEEVL